MGEKTLLIKGKAGLGNRFLAVLGGLLYADMTGRKVVIDWRDKGYSRNGKNSFNVFWETPHAGDPEALEGATSVGPSTWSGRLGRTVDEVLAEDFPKDVEVDANWKLMQRYTADLRRLDDPADVLVRWAWSHELFGLRPNFGPAQRRFRLRPDNTILRTIRRDRVRPSAELAQRVEAFAKEHFTTPLIGLHVRYSDRKLPFEGYRVYVDRFIAERPDGNLFLATDNKDVEAYFKNAYPKMLVAPKWYPPAGEPIHRTDSQGRDPSESGLEALTEMYLLGRCDRLVVNSTSTFGHCALLLSEASEENLIDTAPFRVKQAAKRAYQWVWARRRPR